MAFDVLSIKGLPPSPIWQRAGKFHSKRVLSSQWTLRVARTPRTPSVARTPRVARVLRWPRWSSHPVASVQLPALGGGRSTLSVA